MQANKPDTFFCKQINLTPFLLLYPALNMEESVLREGLKVMEDAIRHVEEHGHTEGDSVAYPSGVSGF
jgi:hypothetical protein